jgi:polar amino acid transport system substrate-binding protein
VHPGFAVEIARSVFTGSGFDVDYKIVNWARCIEDSRAGRFDGIIGAIPADAPDFIFPHEAVGVSSDGYAVRTNDPFQFLDAHSLDGKVLGTVRNYNFSGLIGEYIAAHRNDSRRIEFVSGDDALAQNLAKLAAGRLDVVVDDDNVLRNGIALRGLQDRLKVVRGLNADPVFIAFSPATADAKALADTLDAGILRLRASGRLAEILDAYHVREGY